MSQLKLFSHKLRHIILLLLLAFLTNVCTTSCKQFGGSLLNPETSAFKQYKDSLDTLQMHNYLSKVMEADTTKWKADLMVRQLYDSLANANGEWAVWFDEEGVSEDAFTIAEYLRTELPANGLDTESFLISQIEEDLSIIQKLSFDSLNVSINEVLPRLDYNLSKAYARYATGMRYGFVRPEKLLNKLYIRQDRGYYAHLFDYEITPPAYDEALKRLTADDRVDWLTASKPNNYIYKDLQNHLSKCTDKDEQRKTAVNMERCRWKIKHPEKGQRMVLVNLPSQQLWAIGGKDVLSMKICCGAWDTKTPLLCSQIGYIQVNPEWSLPPKIVESDFSRHVGDSAWFARHKYFVVNRKTGDTLNIASIGASGMKNQGLRFVQRGGAGNSLGRIVFRFLNNFSIYLHDTNQRYIFDRDRRTVSHGCIRVEKPFELACFMLPNIDDWTQDKLRISMDIPPVTERGQKWLKSHAGSPRPYKLLAYHGISPKMPVYIVYYTIFPNPETGVIETWPDFYGYDKAIRNAMQGLLPE